MSKKILFLSLCFSGILFAQIPTPYAKDTARHSEQWVTQGIIYEIYPRSFSREGTFAGIEKKLPALKKLGVTILWIMPIHPVGVKERKGTLGSPYSISDYYGINPEFGTLSDFQHLVDAAHREGFKFIIDLVANHTSWDSKMFTEHPEWFVKDSTGKFLPPNPDWTDVVKLNYKNRNMRRYMIRMMKYWVKDIGIDGYRCDVAEQVPVDFWNDARAALDSIKPVMMLAEGQYAEFHLRAFDLTYSWNYYKAMSAVLDGSKPATEMDSVLVRESRSYPKGSLRLRFSSNHDENAWDNPDVVKFGHDGAMLAAVLTNTYPGVPLLYNGQEVGNDKKLGLFEKIDIDWTKGAQWRAFYTKLFSIRKANPALSLGTYSGIANNKEAAVYSFERSYKNNHVIAVFNFSKEQQTVHLRLSHMDTKKKFVNAFSGKRVNADDIRTLILPPDGYRVFVAD